MRERVNGVFPADLELREVLAELLGGALQLADRVLAPRQLRPRRKQTFESARSADQARKRVGSDRGGAGQREGCNLKEKGRIGEDAMPAAVAVARTKREKREGQCRRGRGACWQGTTC